MKSGCVWLILGSTMTVHFLPFMLHWMGLATFTCSFRFSLQAQNKRWREEETEMFVTAFEKRENIRTGVILRGCHVKFTRRPKPRSETSSLRQQCLVRVYRSVWERIQCLCRITMKSSPGLRSRGVFTFPHANYENEDEY